MPFVKLGPDKYEGPSGRTFNRKQVKLAYATDNFKNMGKATRLDKKRIATKR